MNRDPWTSGETVSSTDLPHADSHVGRVSDRLVSLELVVSTQFARFDERMNGVVTTLEIIAKRPAPGVPVWIVLVMAVPNMLLAIAMVALTVWRIQNGG